MRERQAPGPSVGHFTDTPSGEETSGGGVDVVKGNLPDDPRGGSNGDETRARCSGIGADAQGRSGGSITLKSRRVIEKACGRGDPIFDV